MELAITFTRAAASLLLVASLAGGSVADADPVDFNRDVRPVLSRHCFACHGPDEEAREADLRLDTSEGAVTDLGGHQAIVAGKPDASELITRINSDDPSLVMPPSDSGDRLTAGERQLLHDWIAGGADYDTHWSFTLPRKATPPMVADDAWVRQPIDAFVLAKLESVGLAPAPEADRYRLIRRVSLDLTGLPPTPEAADAFVADERADAFERVVDDLLNSEAYGERWARMWLDLAR